MRFTSFVALALALGSIAAVACVEDANLDAPPSADGGATSDASSAADTSTGAESGTSTSTSVDAGGDAASPRTVTELAAPACHDLVQQAPAIVASASPLPAPAPTPISAIAPGTYVMTSIVEHGVPAATDVVTQRTTVVFTETRQYYISTRGQEAPLRLTLSWSLVKDMLSRTIECSSAPGQTTGSTVRYRIGASPNGFTVYVEEDSRVSAIRYERV